MRRASMSFGACEVRCWRCLLCNKIPISRWATECVETLSFGPRGGRGRPRGVKKAVSDTPCRVASKSVPSQGFARNVVRGKHSHYAFWIHWLRWCWLHNGAGRLMSMDEERHDKHLSGTDSENYYTNAMIFLVKPVCAVISLLDMK